MKKWKIGQSIVLILILLFMAQFLIIPKDSTTPFKTVEKDTIQNIKKSEYTKQDNQEIRRFLSVDPSRYENIAYYKNNDDMQASEIVIVKFGSNDQAKAFEDAMHQRIKNQINVYEGYLPKQADVLKEAVVYTQGNYGIYVTNKKAQMIISQFKQSVGKGA